LHVKNYLDSAIALGLFSGPMRILLASLLLCALSAPAWAQKHAVPLSESHTRVWCVDTVITRADGVRVPGHAATSGKLGYVAVFSKDGRHALVEYVGETAADHSALKSDVAAAASADPLLKVLNKAHSSREDFEAMARAAGFTKADFNRMFVNVR